MIFKFAKNVHPDLYIRCLNEQFRKREAVRLYREVLKTAKIFTWTDERGVPWSKIIKESARAEFEASKQEKDPEVLARALVNGRLALDELHEKLHKKQLELEKRDDEILKRVEASRVTSKYEELERGDPWRPVRDRK